MWFPAETVWRNLYIHVPFCAGKCGYCAFYSETQSSQALRKNYLAALKRFLQQQNFAVPLDTVYIGGGTPNFLSAGEMEELFLTVRRCVPLAADCEISCELNPELLTAGKMSILNEHVSRLSLGVQSFDAAVRRKLMRQCSSEHLNNALELLAKRRAKHFNIDLIYGVESVEWQVFENDLQRAVDCGVDHLSCYALTAEENSRLGLAAPTADDESAAEWWLKIGSFTGKYNIRRYEISNYALPGGECKHNVNVWQGASLLGAGAAASGFDGYDRYTFPDSTAAFIAGGSPEFDRISPRLRMLEILAVNLRTVAGWQRESWEKLYPGTWEKIYGRIVSAAEKAPEQWLIAPERIALSDAGLLFWDDAAGQIIDWNENWI